MQGYIALDREHLEAAYVLAAPNSSLAAFRPIVGKGKELGEYQCPCGLTYFVGECMRPMESSKCSNCDRLIGGTQHIPVTGTVKLEPQQIQNGNFMPPSFVSPYLYLSFLQYIVHVREIAKFFHDMFWVHGPILALASPLNFILYLGSRRCI
jgi:hypothetical protein